MSIDPFRELTTSRRYFPNEAVTLLRPQDPRAHLIQSASRIIQNCSPTLPWASPFRGETYRGFFTGPTSIAYFFWTLSLKHPDLEIEGKRPVDWCKEYLELGQETVPPSLEASCGITNEFLTSNALKACLYQSDIHANKVLNALRDLKTDPTYCEWLKGKAGALYILRMMRQGLPDLAVSINSVIASLIQAMLPQQPWVWNGWQYLGLVHGEIGIVTQIILSDPSYAPKLGRKLQSLLGLQDSEGNWPVVEGKDNGLIQFCHGAPGFVLSLLAIRSHFPALNEQIDIAIARGRKFIWERGLLTKEPNICHGITGNAMALEGPQCEHFLSFATPERIDQYIAEGIYEKDNDSIGLLWGEAGRSWAWMAVLDGDYGRCILYTDV